MSSSKDQEIFYLKGKVERLTKISAKKSRDMMKLYNRIRELENYIFNNKEMENA